MTDYLRDPNNLPAPGDPETIRPPAPPSTVEFTIRHVDPEALEPFFGGPVVPLCERQLPTKGQE